MKEGRDRVGGKERQIAEVDKRSRRCLSSSAEEGVGDRIVI